MVINKKTIATTALTLGVLAGITMSDAKLIKSLSDSVK